MPLTAITNSLSLINELKGVAGLTLIGLGGQYANWCNAFLGPVTTGEIRRLRADCAVLSMAAITDGMVFHQSPEMVETKRAMFDSAAKRILMADHSQVRAARAACDCALDEFDVIVVDDGTPPLQIERMKARGVQVVVAPVKRPGGK